MNYLFRVALTFSISITAGHGHFELLGFPHDKKFITQIRRDGKRLHLQKVGVAAGFLLVKVVSFFLFDHFLGS